MDFVLGVGAQKSGTTWFYHQLTNLSQFQGLGAKELHFWDRLYDIRSMEFPENNAMVEFLRSDNPQKYFLGGFRSGDDYFARLEKRLRPTWRRPKPIVADVTPAYSGLPLFALNQIAKELSSRGIDYRVVFLTRDPLDRIASAVEMNLRRVTPEKPTREGVGEGNFEAVVLRYARSWQCQFRTRYELTLGNLDSAFKSGHIFVGFLEQIGNGVTVAKLEEFLGVTFSPSRQSLRVNAGPKATPWSQELSEEVANLYSPTYAAFESRFPIVRGLWGGFRFL